MSSIGAGTVIAGKYRLEKLLAKGGMGAVWVARHIRLNLVVAIKFIETGDAASDEARVRFEREAKVLAKLKSPHIVHISDYGVEEGVPYLAMELLNGEDLDAKLKREGRLWPADTSILLNQICRGLRVAHDAGLVHRDLKPGNIFLARDDDDALVAKILDFGIAKAVAPGITKDATETGAIIGSPRFMSPEQVRNSKRVDHRSDLWSLAVILFRCVTGRVPFRANEIAVLILEICAEPIPAPSSIDPALGPAMDHFFARALARNPDERFQSARELAEAFAAAAEGISVFPAPHAPALQPAGAGASTQSVSISEMPTLVRGSAASSGAASVTGNTSDGVLLYGTTGARPRSGGGAWIALIALASALVLIGIAAVVLFRNGSGSTAAQAPSSAPSVALPASTGAPASTSVAQSPGSQGGVPAPNAATGSPGPKAPPSASSAAAAPAAPTASSRPAIENKRKPVTGGSDGAQNPPLGF